MQRLYDYMASMISFNFTSSKISNPFSGVT